MKYAKRLLLLALACGLVFCLAAEPASAAAVIKTKEGKLAISYEGQLYLSQRDTGSGPDGGDATMDVFFRRNRITFSGNVNKTVGFFYSLEHQGDRRVTELEVLQDSKVNRLTVLDAFMKLKVSDAVQFRIGLTKDPLVREHNEGCFFPLTLDRSIFVYTSLPRRSRDFGAIMWGNLLDDKLQYKVALMEGADSDNAPSNALRLTGRVHYSIIGKEPLPIYFGSYLGKKKVVTLGAGFQSESDVAYGNVAAQTMESAYSALTYDIYAEYPMDFGTITASAAYLETAYDDAYQGADPDPLTIDIDGEKNGSYVKLGYMLPNKVGNGNLQFFARMEDWAFGSLGGITDQAVAWTGFGANYYMDGHDLRLTLEMSTTDFDKEDATNEDFSTTNLMMQLRF